MIFTTKWFFLTDDYLNICVPSSLNYKSENPIIFIKLKIAKMEVTGGVFSVFQPPWSIKAKSGINMLKYYYRKNTKCKI